MGNVTIDNGNGDTITVTGSNDNTIYLAVSKLAPLLSAHPDAKGGTNKPVLYAKEVFFVPAYTRFIATDTDGAIYAFENKPTFSDNGIWSAEGESAPIGRHGQLSADDARESLYTL